MQIILIITFLLSQTIHAFAVDDEVKKLMTEASGITDEDAAVASRKKELTLFDLYSLAVKTTERVAIEGENSIQAEAKRSQAFGAFLPKVYLRANSYYPDNYRFGGSSQRPTVTLYARQPIMTGLDELSGLKAANSEIKIRKYTLYNNAAQLLMDISSSFYSVIQIEKNLKNNEEILNLYKKTINELARRVAIGRSRQSEVLRTNSGLYKLEAQIKALLNDLTHAKLTLKTLSGISNNVSLIEGKELPDPDYKTDAIRDILARRWDVKAASETVEQAKASVLAAYGGNFPSAYIDATYLLYYDKNFSSNASSANKRDYIFSLGVELPLFSGGIVFAKIKEAQSVKRQAELNLSRTIRLSEQDIVDSYQSWESSRNEVEAFKKALTSAEENYNTVKNEYGLNLVTILDVITSLQSLQSARDDYERTLLQHRLNRIRLGVATNEITGKNIRILKTQ